MNKGTRKQNQENIIATSQKYARQLNDIKRSLYIGEFVDVKYQDPEIQSKRYSIKRTGTICYIHKNRTYFNVRFNDTGVQESYFPSDILEGIVLIDKKGIK